MEVTLMVEDYCCEYNCEVCDFKKQLKFNI